MSEPKRTFQSETLGLPPLKMILIEAEADRRETKARRPPRGRSAEELDKEEAVIRLIEHLTKQE